MKRLLLIACSALLTVAVACEKENVEDNAATIQDNPYKELNLNTKSAEFARAGNTFAFEMLDRVNASEDKDFVISPLSMQFLLGLLLDGAQGQTADEICKVLGYGAGEVDAVNEYCLSMMQQLPELDKQTTLSIANAIALNRQYSILDGYRTSVRRFFDAEIFDMDLENPSAAIKQVNQWCSDHTNGLIPEIIDKIDPDILAILMNAVYFKSRWTDRTGFDKDNTAQEPFTLENGTKKYVPMMKDSRTLMAHGTDVFTALRIPYGNMAYSMMVVLPDEGHTVEEAIQSLKSIDWNDFYHGMDHCKVDLWLPKFETKSSIGMKDILADMGMPSSFNEKLADFKAMSEDALCLSYVQQDAIIKVDEEGTEAAAVSHTGMRAAAANLNEKNIVFHADRPFIYLIYEFSSGAVLFAGKYSGEQR